MAHGMNTMPTARRGRKYYKEGPIENGGLGGACSVIFIVILLIIPPIILFGSEISRHTRYIALSDALDSDIVELNHGVVSGRALINLRPGTLVHGTSNHIDTISSDPDMKVAIPGALTLRRNTEYCQWQEIQSQSCETCNRTVKAKDGSTKQESYQCNCVKEYNYVKTWRSRRINSLLFDQPGAHYNPQRDPMPSQTFVGDDAKLTFHEGILEDKLHHHNNNKKGAIEAQLDPNMLSNGVRNQPYRRIEFVPNGRAPPPSFFTRFFSFFGTTKRTRYEPVQMLKDTPDSPAAIHDNFVYVGQGGFFFSPYESATSSKLFNWFAQYLEGSLFDWQIGDIVGLASCTAGDVRFGYEVQDPTVVSVLGQLGQHSNALQITPRTMNGIGNEKSATIGLVHSGGHSAQAMIIAEDSDSKRQALFIRGLLFLWAVPVSRLAGVAFGRELGDSSFTVQVEGALGIFFTLLGAVWLLIWGESYGAKETIMVFFLGGIFGYIACKSAAKKGAGRWWHAVWCRVAKWANAPPGWRVEDSYVASSSKVGGSIGGGRSKMS
eukprot:CAMPEP_0172306668 /NCGR_PEP_ID=MMETSP1058-20130122/7697_1 /TAXON_ID=83371 /ORGANISM="Detonula confervacea, Strain CCMP 353" /LENGTH=548 /DNA_ID=CAMNT_0013018633 /DNA_START=9 /DNA_END=1655 /DNA_ORIENTATION=-